MGLFDTATDLATKAANKLGFGTSVSDDPPIYTDDKNGDLLALQTEAADSKSLFGSGGQIGWWGWDGSDWYKTFPYQFAVTVDKEPKYFYTLPIPPQAMVTKMITASQATATLGGVVEETSENTFWAIQLTGTTGTGVSRLSGSTGQDDRQKRETMAKEFRSKLETTGLLSGVAASASALLTKVGSIADGVMGAINGVTNASGVLDSVGAAMDGVSGVISSTLLPPLPYGGSAVVLESNGYTEIQELHRFLYTYSKLKSIQPQKFALTFINNKDRQKWNVVVQDFAIQRNAQNPNLYRYTIQLKAWYVRHTFSGAGGAEYDRFGSNGDLKPVLLVTAPQAASGLAKVTHNLAAGKWFVK